jgi:AraC family transcriptional regulator, transcriptional activator FtrA
MPLHRVAILVLPSVVPFDLAVPIQVFGYPRPDLGQWRYRTVACGVRPGRVASSSCIAVHVDRGLGALARADTIIVPGTDDLARPIDPAVTRALRRAHRRGARIASICTGAFVLAEAGLLDGRRATTHWADVPAFCARFPRVEMDPDVLYVDGGDILTSAGIGSGIDLCLHMVAQDHGAEVANHVARRLVVAPHRAGGQAQFIPRPEVDAAGTSLEPTRDWARRRLREPLTVARLAAHAGLSVRTFARRFAGETGTSPLRWLLHERVLAARRDLETTDLPIARVAEGRGFGSAVSMRARFRRTLGTSPSAYRQAFRGRR